MFENNRRLVGQLQIHGGNFKLIGHVTSLIPGKNSRMLKAVVAALRSKARYFVWSSDLRLVNLY